MPPIDHWWPLLLFAFSALTPRAHLADISWLLRWNPSSQCVQLLNPLPANSSADNTTEILLAEVYKQITDNPAARSVLVRSVDRLANFDAAEADRGFRSILLPLGKVNRECSIQIMFAVNASDLATVLVDSGGMRYAPHTSIFVLSANEPSAWTGDQLDYIDENALLVFWVQIGRLTDVVSIVSSFANFRSIVVSSPQVVYTFLDAHRNAVLVNDKGTEPKTPFRISAIDCPPYVKLTRNGDKM